jgi:PAS domain S-box-containing protein
MSPLRLLIVEDNVADVKLLRYELKRDFDFESVVVETEEDFTKKLEEMNPDVILSDYVLPDFSGMRALEIRNEKSPLTPFIFVTGSINEEVAVNSIKAGASDYVTKEHLRRLNVAVKNVLEQRKTLEAKKKAEEELYRSLTQFKKFVENDISGDYLEDKEKVLYCNQKILDIFGFDNLEQLNAYGSRNLYDNPEDRKKLVKLIESQGKVENFEVRMHTRDGKPLVILENAYAEFDENRNLKHIQGYLIDITQRIIAEEKLRHSENLFRTLTENTSAGIVIYNKDNFLYVNPAVTRLTGYTAEEMKKMHFWDVVHPADRELVKKRGQRRIENENEKVPRRYRFRIVSKTGKTFWIDFSAGYIDFEGHKAGLGSFFDVTKEVNALEEIRMLSTAVTQSPLSVVITNLNGKIEYVNKSFERITGYSYAEVIGQNPRILQSGHTRRKVFQRLWDTLVQGKTWRGEFINKKKNGDIYYEYAVITPIRDENGHPVRYIAMKEDITQRKKLEAELHQAKEKAEEASRLKSAFLANISHELRTPLNGILGFSELIQEMEDVEAIREMSSYINESGQRLLRTLDMIIAISRLDSDTYELKNEGLDVIGIFKEIYEKKRPQAEKKNLKMVFASDLEKAELVGDRNVISGALEEIVDNAVKFTNHGTVALYAGKTTIKGKAFYFFRIKDTGIGISKENQKTIFEDFRQASAGYGRKYEGNGLGLSLAKKYVELIGGSLSLTSKEGEGSEFTVYLPVQNELSKK